jgi:hypothetical protein
MKQVTLSVPTINFKSIGGLLDVVGMGILGAPVAYPQIGALPHWAEVTAIFMIVSGLCTGELQCGKSVPVITTAVGEWEVSETIPVFSVGDRVRTMCTDDMVRSGFENVTGKLVRVDEPNEWGERRCLVELDDKKKCDILETTNCQLNPERQL